MTLESFAFSFENQEHFIFRAIPWWYEFPKIWKNLALMQHNEGFRKKQTNRDLCRRDICLCHITSEIVINSCCLFCLLFFKANWNFFFIELYFLMISYFFRIHLNKGNVQDAQDTSCLSNFKFPSQSSYLWSVAPICAHVAKRAVSLYCNHKFPLLNDKMYTLFRKCSENKIMSRFFPIPTFAF